MSEAINKSFDELKKDIKANNAHIAGCLDSWGIRIVEKPEMTKNIIKDMHELAASLRKSAGALVI